ncbi:MAG: hypothetical protein H0V66_01260 [Bdellovibrionales bacterium]|nr:hypothetical protein [Bdellovibrionales bacterium]
MDWSPDEKRLFRSLKTPEKIQAFVNELVYNPTDHASSPRWVMITREGHCFEGGLFAAAALEYHGLKPLMVDLIAEADDHHVLTVYKTQTGWGSIAKSNTTLLAGRHPFYLNVRELVMSYFDFYFNTKGKHSLYGYSNPINLNHYNKWEWRTTDNDLKKMGMSFCDLTHYELISPKQLKALPPVPKKLLDACLLGSDPSGLYQA